MSSIWCGSRPMRQGMTWPSRYEATASSRPLSVASPSPVKPSSVSILRVTKLRPGQHTMTCAAVIFIRGSRADDPPTSALGDRDLGDFAREAPAVSLHGRAQLEVAGAHRTQGLVEFGVLVAAHGHVLSALLQVPGDVGAVDAGVHVAEEPVLGGGGHVP